MSMPAVHKREAEKRRAMKAAQRNGNRIHYDCSNSSFLARMTHEALKEDAPTSMLLALCQFVAVDK